MRSTIATKTMTVGKSILAATASVFILSNTADAEVRIRFSQVGPDVHGVISGSMTLPTVGNRITDDGVPGGGAIAEGGSDRLYYANIPFDTYVNGTSFPSSLNSAPDTVIGAPFAFGFNNAQMGVNGTAAPGSVINPTGTYVWSGQTLADIGFTAPVNQIVYRAQNNQSIRFLVGQSRYMGGSIEMDLDPTAVPGEGLITAEIFTMWKDEGGFPPPTPAFTARLNDLNNSIGSFNVVSNTPVFSTGVEHTGETYTISRQVATFPVTTAGSYFIYWYLPGGRVPDVQNQRPDGDFDMRAFVIWDGSTPTYTNTIPRGQLYDTIAQGYVYTKNIGLKLPVYGISNLRNDYNFFRMPFLVNGYQRSDQDAAGNTVTYMAAADTVNVTTGRWTARYNSDGYPYNSPRSQSFLERMMVVYDPDAAPDINPNPPVVPPIINNRIINVGDTLTFSASATDADGDSLTIRANHLPAGASMPTVTANGSVSTVFSWNPTSQLQSGVYHIEVEAFDNVTKSIHVRRKVRIQVNGSNLPPAISNGFFQASIATGESYTFQLNATDPNPGDTLTYRMPHSNIATVSPTGLVTITPTSTTGWGQFTTYVTDNGTPNLTRFHNMQLEWNGGFPNNTGNPVVTIVGPNPYNIEQFVGSYTEPTPPAGLGALFGATAVDGVGNNISPDIIRTVANEVDNALVGNYPVVYTVQVNDPGLGTRQDSKTRRVDVINSPTAITLNGASPTYLEWGVDTYTELGANISDPQYNSDPMRFTAPTLTIGGDTVNSNVLGTYVVLYTATDDVPQTSTRTRDVIVRDTIPPVFTALPSRIVATTPDASIEIPVNYSPVPAATDNHDGVAPSTTTPSVVLSHPSGATFPLGLTTVTATVTDSSGNATLKTFEVVVVEYQEPDASRTLDMVTVRGEEAGGGTGTILQAVNAYINNSGDTIYSARLLNAADDWALIHETNVGVARVVALEGTDPLGVGNYGYFTWPTFNDQGDIGFRSQLGGVTPGQFVDNGGASAPVYAGGASPVSNNGTYSVIYQPALSSNGELLSPVALLAGSGTGVTFRDDTAIVSSAGTVIVGEGMATLSPSTNFGQLHPRVVTSDSASQYALTAYLETPVFTPATNTGLFVGTLGAGTPSMVVREGDVAPGTSGGTFSRFNAESVNSAGEIAFRASVIGGGASVANNDGIWTNAGDNSAPPVLVAREGDPIISLAPAGEVVFDRFYSFHMNDDGSVVFLAYLKNAPGMSSVTSGNDGSLWSWSNGNLILLAREGELASNTAGGVIRLIRGYDCNNTGGVTIDTTLVPNSGDTTSRNSQAIFIDRGVDDFAPILAMRSRDKVSVDGVESIVNGIDVKSSQNGVGGTGGYGRLINDSGSAVFQLFMGNQAGIFVREAP